MTSTRRVRATAWFLAISYVVAAPVTAYVEFANQALSTRFGYPSAFIYVVCALQLLFSIGVMGRRTAPWSAAGLSVITIGAIVSHLRIGSPLTTVPAIVYTAVQVWFGLASRASQRR